MARQEVFIGSVGPLIYDDGDNDAVSTPGTVTAGQFNQEVGTTNVRLIESDSNKDLQEVSTLANYLANGIAISVSDDGNGGATVNVNINVSVLTDSSGGSTDGTVSAVSGTGDDSTVNDNFAELTQKINELINALT